MGAELTRPMYLRSLLLEEFRLYHHLDLDLRPEGIGLFGGNAGGKSTLLEAIAMLATTRSPRSGSERELINWTSGQEMGFPPFARVRGQVVRHDGEVEIEIALQADPSGVGPLQKAIKLNGRSVRAMDAVGGLKSVLFAPEDVALVSGPPAGRRRHLDMLISQLDGRYLRALARYNRILEQRNSLLKSLSREGASATTASVNAQLAYWDEELVGFGARIVARRMVTLKKLSVFTAERFAWFSGGKSLTVTYRPSVGAESAVAVAEGAAAETAQAMVARSLTARLQEARRDELRRGVCLVGPHRDDVGFAIDGVDLATYGSRGQQRLAVVALKLAETDLMGEEAGEHPLVLLDDVLSELDQQHRTLLTSAVAALGAQVIITATDRGLLDNPVLSGLPRAEVARGQVVPTPV